MNKWKVIGYLCIAGILILLIVWLVDGMEIYTKTGRQETTVDELWGTTEVKWVPDFQLGLLPSVLTLSREAVSVLPIAGVLAVIAFISYRMSRKPSTA